MTSLKATQFWEKIGNFIIKYKHHVLFFIKNKLHFSFLKFLDMLKLNQLFFYIIILKNVHVSAKLKKYSSHDVAYILFYMCSMGHNNIS